MSILVVPAGWVILRRESKETRVFDWPDFYEPEGYVFFPQSIYFTGWTNMVDVPIGRIRGENITIQIWRNELYLKWIVQSG